VKNNKQIASSPAPLPFEQYMALELHAQEVRREMEHKIFVSVQGGVAEVCEETVPAGIVVEILDFDNFAANPERELSLWFPELREYWVKNHAQWVAVATIVPVGSRE
jgi:hypothetical protein